MIVRVPTATAVVDNEAVPPESVAVPKTVEPSLKVTVPVVAVGETEAV